jgi:hypothetical protein
MTGDISPNPKEISVTLLNLHPKSTDTMKEESTGLQSEVM